MSKEKTKIEIGYTYKNGVSGSELKVVGMRNYNYILECSICSLDTELWPSRSIVATKELILNNKSPCGCTPCTQYSKDQWLIIAHRAVEGKNFTIIKILDKNNKKITRQTKIEISCGIHRTTTVEQPLYNLINNGPHCPDCYFSERKQDITKIIGKFHKSVLGRFSKFEVVERWETKDNKIDWVDCYCEKCAVDEYSRNNIGSGWFRIRLSQLKRGSFSCRCNSDTTGFHYTKEQREYQIKKRLNVLGGKFLSWEDNNKVTSRSRFYYECSAGHSCKSNVDNFVNQEQNCMECTHQKRRTFKFNVDAPASLYVARFYSNEESFIKVGITNNDIISRLNKQKSKAYNVFNYTVLLHISFHKGLDALNVENIIKNTFNRKYIPKERFRSGYTETFAPDLETDIISTIEGCYEINNGVLLTL